MATDAPISGTVATLMGILGQQLSSIDTPCRQLSLRSHPGNGEISIGHQGVTVGDRYAFILESEPYTIGPFGPGQGIRPCDIYIVGTVGDSVTWSGIHS